MTAVASGIATAVVALNPYARIVYGQPELRMALETTATLVALLAAFLALSRLRRRGGLTDLVLACALAVIALSNMSFATVPMLIGGTPSNFLAWSAVIGRLLGCLLFGAAAFVPDRRLRRVSRAQAMVAVGAACGLALAVLVISVFAARLPLPVSTASPGRPSAQPVLHAAPVVLVVELATAVLAGLAAAGYLRRSERLGDGFSGWLAIAAVFAAAYHFNYFLYPSMYARVLSVGDAFRLCFYAALLTGSMREIWSYWLGLSDAMVASERRRIARDLHDGLAQELAYLTRNLDSLGGSVEPETLSRLRLASERARLESRLAVNRLAAADQPQLGEAVADAVGEVAKRFDLDLELDLVHGIRLPAARADAFTRIACEAVTNAAQHSGANLVAISVHRESARVRMLVSDRGCGFDSAASTGGFGITSMYERAQSVGAVLTVRSEAGKGSQVEVACEFRPKTLSRPDRRRSRADPGRRSPGARS